MKNNKTTTIMKTKTSFLFAVALMVAGSVFANDSSTQMVVVNGTDASIIKVIYKSETSENVRMKIYNEAGSVVYAHTIKVVNGFMLPINLAGLAFGEYTIEIAGKSGVQSKKIKYGVEVAQARANSVLKTVHVSKVADQNKYIMSIINEGSQWINVKIFDGSDTLIHSESRMIKGNNGLVYTLEQIVGIPTFEVTDKTGVTQVIKK